jgi:hypothetical protein
MGPADAWAGVAVAALALAFTVVTYVQGRALKRARAEGAQTTELRQLVDKIARLETAKDQVHQDLAAHMDAIEDKLDRRVRWLETHLWNQVPTQRRTGRDRNDS